MGNLVLKNIVKNFGATKVVKGIDLEVKDQEFIVFVGPSGCGKSTLLRMMAGLEEVTEGKIFINDVDCTFAEPSQREIAMVFQDYALYPHMSVYENMAFGLRLKKMSSDEISRRVERAAEILDLSSLLQRKPAQLSGGQRQRVAMGRAFVKQTGIYLFDEPLSNLDAKLRTKMRLEIKKFHRQVKGTIVYVTHDQLEAMTLADRIVILNGGRIEQMGSPLEVFDFPHTKFVASFIGSPAMNFIAGTIGEGQTFKCDLGEFALPKDKYKNIHAGQKVTLGIRPSDLYISHDDTHKDWRIEAHVEFKELLGKNAYVTFRTGEHLLVGEIMGRDLPETDSYQNLTLNLNHAHLFDETTQKNLLLS